MTNIVHLEAEIAAASTELAANGFCIIPDALTAETVGNLDRDLAPHFERTPFGEGDFYGTTTKRFGRLLSRSRHAAALVQHELIIRIVEQILLPWCDCIQLNTTQAIAVYPGAPAQLPHRDQDMWRGPVGEVEYLVNVMWPLNRFTAENGATRVWRGAHGAKALEFRGDRGAGARGAESPHHGPRVPARRTSRSSRTRLLARGQRDSSQGCFESPDRRGIGGDPHRRWLPPSAARRTCSQGLLRLVDGRRCRTTIHWACHAGSMALSSRLTGGEVSLPPSGGSECPLQDMPGGERQRS